MPKLIGRDDLLRRVLKLLGQLPTRVVTLTGPGGVGKTRLAREIVAAAQPATFVDLSALRDPSEVLPAIARAVGVRGDSGEPLLQRLIRHLRHVSPLLVLDNLEALLPAASDVDALVVGVPGLRVLATSRIALRIPHERVVDVPPLDLESAAVALYVERAQAIRPDFELDRANFSAVLNICRRLDGLPLAIELAAARVRVLPPRALVSRLDRVYDVVASDLPELPDRQRGLRRLVDWSYQLLDDSARGCYVQAAVFEGGFDLEALAAVTDSAELPRLLEAVDTLTQANLLRQADLDTPEARFLMLETIREHALERLETEAETHVARTRERHATYFARLAEAAEPSLTCHDAEDWLERLERERDNLRAALRWATHTGNAEVALRLAGALKRFWFIRADFVEGERWLNAALRLTNANLDGRLRAKALAGAGDMAARLGSSVTAEQLFQESLTLSRSAADHGGEATALNSLGNVAFDRGDYVAAGRLYRDSLALRRQQADRRGISVTLNNLGNVSLAMGDYAAAAAAHEESIALRRDLGDRHGLATSLNNLADLELRRGDFVRATQAASEGLSTCYALNDRLGVAHALLLIAELEVLQSRLERGVRLLAGVEQLSAQLGGSRGGDFQARVQRVLGVVGSRLPDEVFSACWTSGLAMSVGELVRVALVSDAPEPVAPADTAELSRLTDRERDVLMLVGRGRTNRQIADELVISESTAAVHVKHILRKLGCSSRAQAAVWAVQHGLLAA